MWDSNDIAFNEAEEIPESHQQSIELEATISWPVDAGFWRSAEEEGLRESAGLVGVSESWFGAMQHIFSKQHQSIEAI